MIVAAKRFILETSPSNYNLSVSSFIHSILFLLPSLPFVPGDEARRGLVTDAAEGGVPDVRGPEEGARRSDRPHRHGGGPADLTRAVVVSAVWRPGPQVPHAVHHRQGTWMKSQVEALEGCRAKSGQIAHIFYFLKDSSVFSSSCSRPSRLQRASRS